MADFFDMNAGRLIIRRPNGQIYLDSNDRTLVQLGERTISGVTVKWPKFSSEAIQKKGNERRWKIGKQSKVKTIVLGGIGTATPNWIMVNGRGDRKGKNGWIFWLVEKFVAYPENEWLNWGGPSLWCEYITASTRDPMIACRVLTVMPSGGNFVLRMQQSSRAYVTDYGNIPVDGDTASKHVFDFDIAWGVFDL